MDDNQGKHSFHEKQSLRTYNLLAFLIVLLVLCAAGLNYRVDALQEELTQQATSAQAQSMLTQRIALLIAQYQTSTDGGPLEDLRDTASAALVNHSILESAFSPLLPPVLSNGSSTQDVMERLNDFATKSMAYASAPLDKGAKETGQALIARARDIAGLWDTITTDYITALQKKINTASYISMGLYLLILGMFVFQFLKLVRPAMGYIAEQRKHIARLETTDFLTGLYSRSTLFKTARALIGTYKRQEQPIAIFAIDIDKLGRTNETYGRASGDALIKHVAATLKDAVRPSDIIGRLGGGEFCVFLPSLDEERASPIAEKLRRAIESMSFVAKENTVLVSVSIGVAAMAAFHNSPDDMLLTAEQALRQAKENGRNCVVVASVTIT